MLRILQLERLDWKEWCLKKSTPWKHDFSVSAIKWLETKIFLSYLVNILGKKRKIHDKVLRVRGEKKVLFVPWHDNNNRFKKADRNRLPVIANMA